MGVYRIISVTICAFIAFPTLTVAAKKIQHDAEYYVVQTQHAEQWAAEDDELDKRLKALRDKYGNPPNIVHIMWDDNGIGEFGNKLFNKIRGYNTPKINALAKEGATFARMYTEPSCTPSRAAALTGRLPIRCGMFKVLFPPDGMGLPGEEVTIAEVLSKAGYATAFYGKAHQGDIKESYPHNQGFDEANASLYNQAGPTWWNELGEAAGATVGWSKDTWDKEYALDQNFRPYDYVMAIEAKKGDKVAKEWAVPSIESYNRLHSHIEKKSMEFIQKNAKSKEPFYLAYWPNLPVRPPAKLPGETWSTSSANWYAEAVEDLDKSVGKVIDELKRLGIAENTLVIAMADNGPMEETAPVGPWSIFRGGKGSFLEGGIRVTAWAWWPGVIEPDTVIGDIIHISDLFTTFARLGGGMKYIPTDRVIDGIDQTALLINGDTHGRRDYNIVYSGPMLAAITKQQFKRHFIGDRPGLVGKGFFNLYWDPREEHGMMQELLWAWGNFELMKERHEKLIEKYPNTPPRHGDPLGGIERISR
ncbi:sulfatase-like hydrolase/transferase [Desulfoluna spongiiphila]|uniref:Arylsulfatase n=1 Tax=Desulfoluna spongiiphila TaxID=419481 RepID=A0A1G5ESQ3_9BACT|nr:sulfatase-like hydrolase/transferase [Desulfoluna spongiiphila]SCY30026.1 arylsulfatase [Desulfoluna spongiiphila]VVS91314.1 consensus disorder prediction [Desulfoluna spongiiphila]